MMLEVAVLGVYIIVAAWIIAGAIKSLKESP